MELKEQIDTILDNNCDKQDILDKIADLQQEQIGLMINYNKWFFTDQGKRFEEWRLNPNSDLPNEFGGADGRLQIPQPYLNGIQGLHGFHLLQKLKNDI